MRYRRVIIPGACYFFTINLQDRKKKGERGIWQKRFWEHLIRDEADFEQHVNYIHYNPVKHGYVANPSDWGCSGFPKCKTTFSDNKGEPDSLIKNITR